MTNAAEGFPNAKRFEFVSRLGSGGMGVVFEAIDHARKQKVALKVLRRVDARAIARFKNEFRALHDIDHPNLIRLHELLEDSGSWFFTMELLEGQPLLPHVRPEGWVDPRHAQATARNDRDSEAETLTIQAVQPATVASQLFLEDRLRRSLAQLARGVAALHAHGRVHRDIKPSNVMVTSDGTTVLLDFGLVVGRDALGDHAERQAAGTPAYMSPEQAYGDEVDGASDWYSFGVLMYESLTDLVPDRGSTPEETVLRRREARSAARPSERVQDVPLDLDDLCVELLDPDPARRPSAEEILRRLGGPIAPVVVGVDALAADEAARNVFVGRDEELRTLRAHFAASRSRPTIALVRGESGVGKSHLVERLVESLAADHDGLVVLAGRCYERESATYKAMDGIVDSLTQYMEKLPKHEAAVLLPTEAGLLPKLFPALRRVEAIAEAPEEREIADHSEQRRRMFGALRDLFVRLAKRRPVVAVCDDLQWADADSNVLLQDLLGHPNAPNLFFLATLRPVTDSERAASIESLGESADLHFVELGELSMSEATELARRISPGITDEACRAIASEAGGHPLFTRELVRRAAEADDSTPTGVSLDDALWSRIDRTEGDVRAVLEVACIADKPIPQQVVGDAVGVDYSRLQQATSSLRAAHLVRTDGARLTDAMVFYHDRIREVVVGHLDADRRRHWHHRLAITLERAGAVHSDPQALVRHAEAGGDEQRAADYARAAAGLAVEAMAFDQAAGFFALALRLGDFDPETARGLRARQGSALAHAGRGPEAADAFLAAAEGADPELQIEYTRQAAEQCLITGHIERGLRLLKGLLDSIGEPLGATTRRALLSVLWNRARLRLRGLNWKKRRENEIAPAALVRLDVLKPVAQSLALVDNIRGADFNSRFVLQALRTGESRRIGMALGVEAAYLSTQTHASRRRARALVSRIQELADQEGDSYLHAWAVIADGIVAHFEGRFVAAENALADAEQLLMLEPDASTYEHNNVRLFRVFCINHIGALAKMAEVVARYLRDADRRGDRYLGTSLRRYGRTIHLAKDDPETALAEVARGTWASAESGYHLQHLWELEARGDIGLYQGRAAEILEETAAQWALLRKSMLLRVQMLRVRAFGLHARILLAHPADHGDASARRKEAVQLTRKLARERIGYAEVPTMLLQAGLAAGPGGEGLERAAEILRQTIARADEIDLAFHAAVARRRLGVLVDGAEGEELVATANAWFEKEQVRNPDRMLEVVAPGFD